MIGAARRTSSANSSRSAPALTSPVDIDVDTNTNANAKAKAGVGVDLDLDFDADADAGASKKEMEASDSNDNDNDDGESHDEHESDDYDDDDDYYDGHSTPLSTDLTSAVASALIIRRQSSIPDSKAKAASSSSPKMTASARHSFLLNKMEALVSTSELASVSTSAAVAASVSTKRKSSSISSSSISASSTAAVFEPPPGPAPLRYVHPSFTTGIPPVPPKQPLASNRPYPKHVYHNPTNYTNKDTNKTGNARKNANANTAINGYGNRGLGQIPQVPTPGRLTGNGNINRSGNGNMNMNMYGQTLGHSQVQMPIPIQPRMPVPRVPTPAVVNENMYGNSLSHMNGNGYGIRNMYGQMPLNSNYYGNMNMNGNMNGNMNAYHNGQGGLMNGSIPYGFSSPVSNGYGQLRQHINGSIYGNQLQQQQQYMNRNPYSGQSPYLNGNTNPYILPHPAVNGNVNMNGASNVNGNGGTRLGFNSYNTGVNVNTNLNTNLSLAQSPIMATANNMDTSSPIPKNVSIARAAVPAPAPVERANNLDTSSPIPKNVSIARAAVPAPVQRANNIDTSSPIPKNVSIARAAVPAPVQRVVINVDADADADEDEVEYVGMVGSPGPQSPYMQARRAACRKKDERGPRIVCVSSVVASSCLKEKKEQQSPNKGQSQSRSGSDDQQDQIQIPPQHLEEINTKVLARAFSWTCYHHMDQYEQELLWVVEASKYLRSKSNSNQKLISPSDENQSRLDYVKNNISDDLAVLTDVTSARSVSEIIRGQSAAMERIQKMEFIAKRNQAPMAMKTMIDELCIEIGGQGCAGHKKRQLESYFLNERWNRYEDCTAAKARGKDVIKRDETVYICETGVNEGTGESELTCYRCIVLGCKEVEKASCSDGFVYYNVMKDDAEVGTNGSHLVERVHAESVLTGDEIGELIDMEVERLVAILTPSRKGLLL